MTETNKTSFLIFLRNLAMYVCIGIFGILLYNFNNINPKNIPHTDFSFVYAQF